MDFNTLTNFNDVAAMLRGNTQDQMGQIASLPQTLPIGPDLASQPAPTVQGASAPQHNTRDAIKNAVTMFLLAAGRGYGAGGGLQGMGAALQTPFVLDQQRRDQARQQMMDEAALAEQHARTMKAQAEAAKAQNDILPNADVDLSLLGKLAGITDPDTMTALKNVPAGSSDQVAKALHAKIAAGSKAETPKKIFDATRGMLVDENSSTATPVMTGGFDPRSIGAAGPPSPSTPIGPREEKPANPFQGGTVGSALTIAAIKKGLSPDAYMQQFPDEARAVLEHAATLGPAAAVSLQQAQTKGSPLEDVPQHLIQPASDKYAKSGEDYAKAVQAGDDMKTFIDLARSGNKLAYSYAPTEGVLTLNSARGVTRVNMPEIQSYGAAGSALDRVKGYFGKATQGASIPANILNDMESLHAAVVRNAAKKHSNDVKVINSTYGSKFQPMELGGNQSPAPQGIKVRDLKTGQTGTWTGTKEQAIAAGKVPI